MVTLKRLEIEQVQELRRAPFDTQTLAQAGAILEDVRAGGEAALRAYAEKFQDIQPGEPLIFRKEELLRVLDSLDPNDANLLKRCAARVERFAKAQRDSFKSMEVAIPGGRAGHDIAPVERAGCYAPGGRFPLPSSVLMTAVTARVAGVKEVWVASPRPTLMTLAAAAAAGADALLAVGGAQAIAALAFGAGEIPPCDAIVGPGNRWVTAAKQLVAGHVAIDMLAGPSELVIVADSSASVETVAADLLAQAEHDPDAVPILISLDPNLTESIQQTLLNQLADLPTAEIAKAALANGFVVEAQSVEQAAALSDRLAPEHLELVFEGAQKASVLFHHFGALFVGHASAEVLGDYCIGPNHVLPTGGTARSYGGLSVNTFLRLRTWMRIDHLDEAQDAISDAVQLARHEGLEGHARSALRRLKTS